MQKSYFFVFFVHYFAKYAIKIMELRLRSGETIKYNHPIVMGIINVTPDSFYKGSRCQNEEDLRKRVRQIINEGGHIIDVGACSTRPGSEEVSEADEMQRLAKALPIINDEMQKAGKKLPVSVDTFHAGIARKCVLEYGADIINDISGGTLDEDMLPTIAQLKAPYVLMHMRGTPQTMQSMTDYPEGVTNEVISFFRQQMAKLEEEYHKLNPDTPVEELQMGNVILDPGFGFAKTIEQSYMLFTNIFRIKKAFRFNELLVGISRKSMIYKLLRIEPDDPFVLNATTVLHSMALISGADILRVHDVKEAVDLINSQK